jgi:elongation factor Ts
MRIAAATIEVYMEITASLVKELRERSGAGMMECKKALTENAGNIDAAMEYLRKSGLAKADKKAGRVAAEGRIVLAQNGGKAVLVEINSETDFVGKDDNFVSFANAVAQIALQSGATDIDALKAAAYTGGGTVEEARQALVAKVGERSVRTCRFVAWPRSTAAAPSPATSTAAASACWWNSPAATKSWPAASRCTSPR